MNKAIKKKIFLILLILIAIFLLVNSLILYRKVLLLQGKSNYLIELNELYQGAKVRDINEIKDLETEIENRLKIRPAIEWLNDKEFVVYRGCGTECQIAYIFDIEKNYKRKLFYGVGYQWSPDKELVVAYHFSGGYGITVGDKYGNVLFEFRRPLPLTYSKLTDETEIMWSDDSKILILIIKKADEEELETIKFDVDNDFKVI